MARTKGSGWGGGMMLYQYCPFCGKKKVIYDPIRNSGSGEFRCTSCKTNFNSEILISKTYL